MSNEPTIAEMNEAIAKFIGGLKVPHPSLGFPHMGYYCHMGQWWNEDKLQYHSSWDWLMPIGKRIRDLLSDMLSKRPPHTACMGDVIEVDITCALHEYDIKKVHEAIYVFIKWYNQQKEADNER